MKVTSDYDRSLAEFVTSIRFDHLSTQDRSVAKAGIFDCLAVMISGSQSRTVRCLMEEVRLWGGVGKAVVVGYGQKLPAVWASLINGTAAHAEHFDDLNFWMSGHPSCVLVPVLVSLSWMRKLSGRDWLTAYACGFEIGVRLGRTAHPSLYSMGFHETSVLGVVMAASAAAYLLELDVVKTLSALGISASLAAGVRANFGSMSQALHVGHATSQGVFATLLAEKGFSSDPEAITGRYGLLDCYAGGQYHCEELDNLGKPFELSRSGINFKFYPSGHPTICAIEAALHLRSAYHFSPEMIEEIHCFVGPWIEKSLNKSRPLQKGKEGKVNLPYCLAVALYRGNVVESDFRDEVLGDPNITKLRNCCHVHIVEDLPDEGEFPARVKIRLSDGRIVAEQRDRSSGSAANPPPRERLVKKFQNQSLPVLGPEPTERLITQLVNLEDIHDVTSVTELLQVNSNASRKYLGEDIEQR
jgi:2-methylcitrate dehydratase PrpD